MKKLLTLTLLSAIFLSSAIFSAKAAYDFTKDSGVNALGEKAGYTINNAASPEYYVGLVLSIIFSLLGLVFMLLTIYAGINWMTAQGNTSQIDKAKDTLTRAIIGLVICIVAYGITFFVVNMFQGDKDKTNFIDSNIQTDPNAVQQNPMG